MPWEKDKISIIQVGSPGGSALTFTEQRAHFALWAIIKSPLIIGADLRCLSTPPFSNMLSERHSVCLDLISVCAAGAVSGVACVGVQVPQPAQ